MEMPLLFKNTITQVTGFSRREWKQVQWEKKNQRGWRKSYTSFKVALDVK